MKLLDLVIDSFYPRRCAACKVLISDGHFCSECLCQVRFVEPPVCTLCGNNLKNCQCDTFIYHFDGVVAPLVNQGIIKQTFYNFKFNKDFDMLSFVTDNICKVIESNYGDIKFDMLTFVPKDKGKYNQCRVLARELSKKIKIKIDENTLVKIKPNNVQHKLSLKERFDNAKDVYRSTKSLKGKTVLLLDDIKTTGATLNECARELKFAGAEKVYCVTALLS